MKNIKVYLLSFIIILFFSNTITFIFSNGINIAIGNKVIVEADDASTAKYIEKLLLLKDKIKKGYYKDVNVEDLLNGAINGMFNSLGDPYSLYFTKSQYETRLDQLKGDFVGIGIRAKIDEEGKLTVESLIKGGPSEKAGIEPGDKIIAINDKDISTISLEEIGLLLKGISGTKVKLKIIRNSDNKYIIKEIIRKKIILDSISGKLIDNKIGFIKISMFDEHTENLFKEQLLSLNKQGIKGLIIDLRDNPGGSYNSVVKIADMVLGKSVIVYTQDKTGVKKYEYSDEQHKINIPLVVLVNKGTASASEIFTGAIKDTNSGIIVGTTTFGKGVVQEVKSIKDGSGYQITISEYFTASDKSIHGIGIEPDVFVDSFKKDSIKMDEDAQLQKGIEIINNEIRNHQD